MNKTLITIKEINTINRLIKWKAFIAGWCCRSLYENQTPKDIDIFLYNENNYNEVVSIFSSNFIEIENEISDLIQTLNWNESNEIWENELVKNFKTDNWLLIQLVKPKIQKYMRTWWTPEEVVGTFDFTACRLYLCEYEESDEDIEELSNFDIDYLDYNNEFDTNNLNDIDNKILFVKNIVCPISSIRRALKYAWYGYYLPIQELLKLLKEIEVRKMPLDELMETAKEDLYHLMQHFD